MDRPRSRLFVISPCFNEAEGIAAFYAVLRGVLDSLDDIDAYVLLVDDGSTDGTPDTLNSLARDDERLLICTLSRNFGHQAALSAGLDLACGDAVVMLDSDLQHP